MKRLFILAAAVFTLASCAKTQVVYNEELQEIAFKTVSGVMTKAGDPLPETMGVISYLGDQEYFGETSYSDNGDYWVATDDEDKKYWPVDGELSFIVFAPFDDNNYVFYNNTAKTLTFTVDNSTLATQEDWLYGEEIYTGTKAQYGNTNMDVTLKHALAKVEINVAANADNTVTLVGVNLKNTRQKETGTVTYSAAFVTWTDDGDKTTNMVLLSDGTNYLSTTFNPYSCLVVPTETLSDEELYIQYKLEGSNVTLDYTVQTAELGTTWEYGKKYVYNITIGASEIKIAPEVTPWDADTDGIDGDDETPIEI